MRFIVLSLVDLRDIGEEERAERAESGRDGTSGDRHRRSSLSRGALEGKRKLADAIFSSRIYELSPHPLRVFFFIFFCRDGLILLNYRFRCIRINQKLPIDGNQRRQKGKLDFFPISAVSSLTPRFFFLHQIKNRPPFFLHSKQWLARSPLRSSPCSVSSRPTARRLLVSFGD